MFRATHPDDSPLPAADVVAHGVVLVVDDNEALVALAARILAREGLDVAVATDGPSALARFDEHRERLAAVIVDATLPGMGGGVLHGELVARGLRAPVIASSGFAESEALASFPVAPVSFLQKPYGAAELVGHVRSAIDSTSPRR